MLAVLTDGRISHADDRGFIELMPCAHTSSRACLPGSAAIATYTCTVRTRLS